MWLRLLSCVTDLEWALEHNTVVQETSRVGHYRPLGVSHVTIRLVQKQLWFKRLKTAKTAITSAPT